MFATSKVRLVYTSNSTIAKTMKGLVGMLTVFEDERATFKVGESRVLNTSKVNHVSVHGRWLSVRTDNSTYCFEAVS